MFIYVTNVHNMPFDMAAPTNLCHAITHQNVFRFSI